MTVTNPSAGTAAAPPSWSLITPDTRQGGARTDAQRAAQAGSGEAGPGGARRVAEALRPSDRPEPVRHDALFGENGLSFDDILDTLNPLQHLPVVASIYRELTGDEISSGARMAGGTLYGGPVGLMASAVDAASVESSGKDIGQHAMAFLFGEGAPEGDAGTAVAEASGNAAQPAATPATIPAATDQAAAQAPAAQQATPQQTGDQTAPRQVASAGPTAFFQAMQQPKTNEVPRQAAQGTPPAGGQAGGLIAAAANGNQPSAQPSAMQAGLQAGRAAADTGTGVMGGIRPSGFIQPGNGSQAPAAQSSADPAARAERSAGAPGRVNAGQENTPGNAPSGPTGPTTLSPAAAQALMRMAEASAGSPAAPQAQAQQPQAQPTRGAEPARAATGHTGGADDTGTAGAPPRDLAPEQVPQAMMRALEKYEAMKRDG